MPDDARARRLAAYLRRQNPLLTPKTAMEVARMGATFGPSGRDTMSLAAGGTEEWVEEEPPEVSDDAPFPWFAALERGARTTLH